MARISKYPIFNHLRSEAASHVIRYRNGGAVRSGRGVAFWFRPLNTAVAGDRRLCFFVREAWPSPTFGTSLTAGVIEAGEELQIVSELDEGGVLFGDGIETDRLAFGWGVQATVRVAPERLRLVQGLA